VYFGDIGHNATTVIEYFEKNGSRKCHTDENPYVTVKILCYLLKSQFFQISAEFMLDVIGAGAAATSEEGWHATWLASKEAQRLQQELDAIHLQGRNRPLFETALQSEFATSWLYQTGQLFKRDIQAHWRSPIYLRAKFALNAMGGLYIGFSFFHSKDSQQGTQNKLFVRLSSDVTLITNLLQSIFLASILR
jgi:ATP-binding cassette, subfamily G (WHITE), member 2, PDR